MPIIQPSRVFEGSDLIKQLLTGDDLNEAVEQLLGPVDWHGDSEGFIQCPGSHLHNCPSGARDCKLYLKPVPVITCFHNSCKILVEEATKDLRRLERTASGVSSMKTHRLTKEEKLRLKTIRHLKALRIRTRSSRKVILRENDWPYAAICNASPIKIGDDPSLHWRSVVGLFSSDEVIWAGGLMQTGKAEHSGQFKSRAEWLAGNKNPGHFICPTTFKAGSVARTKGNMLRRAFLVVESDELDKNTVGAIFKWLRDRAHLRLRCIVDTGGKSLHGWFDFPAEEQLADLKTILPELGCDAKMFNPTQPCRLPGALRDRQFQKLIYLSKEDTNHE